ncbi:MAG: aminotransferase class III-fold pyridoxal phosphate-dependent enzyme [Acidobacteriia bacterium]|nr:aminotransferase class III-fold pyridoxal phosphate-dependent enzyme [Terriglobia bacterium]
MGSGDHTNLLANLREAYASFSPKSGAIDEMARRHLVDGGSHQLRLMQPFAPRIVSARGAHIRDEDGHNILDFWQGHLGNVLGHNPPVVTDVLARAFADGFGLQTGFTDLLQVETAELLCRQTGAERVRFTTSGSLATMYAIMLARSFTGRTMVLKIGGGWHGGQPWGLKGVSFHEENGKGFMKLDSEGLSSSVAGEVAITGFNDTEGLQESFRRYGDRLACFIVEPFIGAGGLMPATREFLHTARELTLNRGALLIFDEVICGFRFRAGNLGALYGIAPDLSVFGKIIGGGMPVAAVAGRADVMGLAGRSGGGRVKFSGGTFSAHPASMLAAKTMLEYLIKHEAEIYPRLAILGEKMRRALETACRNEGFYARCSGSGNDAVPGSSLGYLHFPYREDTVLDRPEKLFDPSICDAELSAHVLPLALLLENVYFVHGHGAVSTAHTDEDMAFLELACQRAARRIRTGR